MTRRKRSKKSEGPDAITRAAETGEWTALARIAARDTRINTARVEAGETYAGRRPTGPSPAPSATGSTRNS